MGRKIIHYELNEVPLRIVDEFCEWQPDSALARLLPRCFQYESFAEDDGELSPWITWPSLHRGVSNKTHHIHNFGQDLEEADEAYPPIWKILAENGISTGVFGSLHTYPAPDNLSDYSFYLPDAFAQESKCAPEMLVPFQEFNLQMARGSARNVSTKMPWKATLDFAKGAPRIGLKAKTYLDVGRHLAAERAARWKTARRRTYQSVLAFDVFEKLLRQNKPAFATFFTNHVASSMHRYWAARFPDEYEHCAFDEDWRRTYGGEIEFAMGKASDFLARLVKFVDHHREYQLWLTTSMGQQATTAEPLDTQLYITDRARFMAALGVSPGDWEELPAMLPRYTFALKNGKEAVFREAASKIAIQGKPMRVREEPGNRFFIKIGEFNLRDEPDAVTFDGSPIDLAQYGLDNVEIADRSNTTAYHIPQGSVLVYDPTRAPDGGGKIKGGSRSQISILDVAPKMLENFAIPVPAYMKRPAAMAGL